MNSDGEVLRSSIRSPPNPVTTCGCRSISTSRGSPRRSSSRASRTHGRSSTSSGKNLIANAGAVVVLDPKTGGIVAMASWPSFRPSWFVRGLTHGQRSLLFESEQAPMLNRATQITYAPGSTFKPFVALAAVKERIASFGSYYDCPAEYVHPGDESGTVFENWSGQSGGTLSIAGGLKVSCDSAVLRLGAVLREGSRHRPGGLPRRMRQWGFGRATVDLRRRRSGPFRTTSTSPSTTRCIRTAGSGIDILLAVGSGEMKATPLQVAQAYAALASGRLCRPTSWPGSRRGRRGREEDRRQVPAGRLLRGRTRLHPRGPPRCHDDRRDGGIGVRGVSARRLREDRDRRAPAVPGHVVVRRHGACGGSGVRGRGHRGTGRVRGRRPPPRSSGTS